MSVNSPFGHPWWYPFGTVGRAARFLDDWLISDLSYMVREDPDWVSGYKDPKVVQDWKKNFLKTEPKTKYPEEVFTYMLRELQWYEQLQSREELVSSGFKFGPNDMILWSDKAVAPESFRRFQDIAIASETSILRDEPRPDSDNPITNLVHPSSYCLVYGRTKALIEGKLQEVRFDEAIAKVKEGVADFGVSKKFQWLPASMQLNSSSRTYEFSSYISGIHPVEYSALYQSIAHVFNSTIPGLNMCLSRLQSEEYLRIEPPEGDEFYNEEYDEYLEEMENLIAENADDEEWAKFAEGKRAFYRRFPPIYKQDPETKSFSLYDFQSLKVMVKMESIDLTPDMPEYEGGTWHNEGKINEDIVATAIYFYSIKNIKKSSVSFRSAFEDPDYEQDDKFVCEDFFGLKEGSSMTRLLGEIEAKEGRVLVFPSCTQHRIVPCSLADKSRIGHQKILLLHLVDPYNNSVKAANIVPPQNQAWVNDEQLMGTYFPGIDVRIITTQTAEEAAQYQRDLITERKTTDQDEEGAFQFHF